MLSLLQSGHQMKRTGWMVRWRDLPDSKRVPRRLRFRESVWLRASDRDHFIECLGSESYRAKSMEIEVRPCTVEA